MNMKRIITFFLAFALSLPSSATDFQDIFFGVVEASFITSTESSSDLTEYTFSGVSLGTAHTNRRIVVVSGANKVSSNRSISSMTIGGVSASFIVKATTSGGTQATMEIWSAIVPTGTTGDIVVTGNAGLGGCGIDVYRLIGANSVAAATLTDITDGGANDFSGSLYLPGGGVIIAGFHMDSSASRTATWTNLTEKSDRNIQGDENVDMSTAMTTAAASTTVTITATASGALAQGALAAASFAPD